MADAPCSNFVALADGTELPVTTRPSPLDIIVGHGLGTDPAAKSHLNDLSMELWSNTLECLTTPDLPSSGCTSNSLRGTSVFYTARGHGASSGWDRAAIEAAEASGTAAAGGDDTAGKKELLDVPFRWPNLGEDMLAVADSCGLGAGSGVGNKFVALGQSMGAASALYMTIGHPARVGGLVLGRSPRAWEERRRVAPDFVGSAEMLKKREPGTHRYLPILGAARTDLPPKEDRDAYRAVRCPVLILSHGQDEAHPIETGRALAELIPQARFEVATNEEEAKRVWPGIIADWLLEEGLVGRGDR